MKRACAILGPTPYFVRWAIELACPFREIYPRRLPETTFRQLRSVREVSLGRSEERICQGICLHPSVDPASDQLSDSSIDQVLGFPIDEVLDLVGGEEFIDQNCGSCPANAPAQTGKWAGCYGGLATDLRIDFQFLLQGRYLNSSQPPMQSKSDLISMVDQLLAESDSYRRQFEQLYEDMACSFFAFWVESPVNAERLVFLHSFFSQLLVSVLDSIEDSMNPFLFDNNGDKQKDEIFLTDLRQMVEAMERSIQHRLPFHAELVPTGHSDGIHWRLNPHCGRCKLAWSQRQPACRFCGPVGRYQNEIKLKVLGLRPYLRLADIIGPEQTESLLEHYRNG